MVGIEALGSYALNPNYVASYAGALFDGLGPVETFVDTDYLSGNLSNGQPVLVPAQTLDGFFEKAYFNDYYNRVWILPTQITFGEVSAQTLRNFLIWNAYLTQVTVSNIVGVNDLDIVYGNINISQVLQPLQAITAFASTGPQGSDSIDAAYIFTFSLGAPITIQLFGTRSVQWPFRVDWQSGYEVSYEFRTDEITSRSGKVQRRGLRNHARRSIRYTAGVFNYETSRLSAIMAKRQSRAFTITDDSCTISPKVAVVIGDDTLVLSYLPQWVQVGQTYVIESSAGSERKELINVTGNLLTWDAGYALNHPKTLKLKKIVPVLLSTDVRADRISDGNAVVPFDFIIPPGLETPWPDGAGVDFFESREVLLTKPNWIEGIDLTHTYPREELDYGRSIINYNYPINFGTQGRSFLYTGFDYQQIETLINFFRRHKGRLREFWTPTWENDIIPVADIITASNSFVAQGLDLFRFLQGDTVHKALYIRTKQGQVILKRVSAITRQGNNSFITVSTNFANTILKQDILQVGWLLLSRFASDTLTVNMVTDSVAGTRVAVVSLEVD